MRSLVLFSLAISALTGFSTADHDGKFIEEYPSLVQIEVGFSRVWSLGCMGSVLTSRHILSAARCFSGPMFTPIFRRVRAGATFRGRDGTVTGIERVSNHPSYGTSGAEGDISVVRLAMTLTFGTTIAQGSIIGQGIIIPPSLRVEHAGWGSTAQQKFIANRGLYSIDLFTVDNNACIELYNNLFILDVTITDNMICAGLTPFTGRDADVRDAGGPLYYDRVMVGILSFGHYLGNNSYPLVATKISSYTNWIVSAAV